MKIQLLEAYQIFDSRGMPTLEVELTLDSGIKGFGLVPSGASTGQFEALELRDGDSDSFQGKSVFKAIEHVNDEIAAAIRGYDIFDQLHIDQAMIELDGTPNKSRLGANTILGVSMAVANAAANSSGMPLYQYLGNGKGNLLPLPEIQIIGGGAHANWRIDIQDFMVIATGARSYEDALKMTFDVYQATGEILQKQGKYFGLADEGGYWPEFDTNEQAFKILIEAIELAGYIPGKDIAVSLDIAASDLYDQASQTYQLHLEQEKFSPEEFSSLMIQWCKNYPIISLEDPAADTDWAGWERISSELGDKVQIVGDDLFTTNINRIRSGIDHKIANSVLIKLNQIGTVSETLDAIDLTQQAGWLPIVSARSGETEDAFISHLAVATNAGQLKVGSFARSERMVKWNECLRIQRSLGDEAKFLGAGIYSQVSKPS